MFDDHLVRKQALLDYKILINKVATLDFIKVVILLFWLKKWKFHICLLFDRQGLKIMFDDYIVQMQSVILVKKKLEISFLFVFGQERPRNNV